MKIIFGQACFTEKIFKDKSCQFFGKNIKEWNNEKVKFRNIKHASQTY